MNATMFPILEVQRITKTASAREFASWQGGTLADLRKLVEIGATDRDERQNASPSIGEFLDELAPYEAKVRLIGYIVYPPRDDARVSIEGFTASGLTAEEALDLFARYHADENDKNQEQDGTWSVRFWWD